MESAPSSTNSGNASKSNTTAAEGKTLENVVILFYIRSDSRFSDLSVRNWLTSYCVRCNKGRALYKRLLVKVLVQSGPKNDVR